jgi:hypothetical protein
MPIYINGLDPFKYYPDNPVSDRCIGGMHGEFREEEREDDTPIGGLHGGFLEEDTGFEELPPIGGLHGD